MMPGSALTRLLNGTPELVSDADLSVIAGDIEAGDGLWNTLKVLASDWFYRNEHDLVVDTGSMSGGLPRPANGARLRKDAGPKVNHFRYFTNEQSVRWLQAGLARADGDSGGFVPLVDAAPAAPRCQAAVARSRGDGKPRPIAVVLPGTMGSQLRVDDDTVWLDYWALLKGGLKRLAMGRDGIAPVGLVDQFYGPLVEFLARSHQVEIFPYDWRHSVRKAAARLADNHRTAGHPGRTQRPAAAPGRPLDGRPRGARDDRRRRRRRRAVAAHHPPAGQPLPDARHAEPRLLRGGALADRLSTRRNPSWRCSTSPRAPTRSSASLRATPACSNCCPSPRTTPTLPTPAAGRSCARKPPPPGRPPSRPCCRKRRRPGSCYARRRPIRATWSMSPAASRPP
jgi:hypothetical protein